jgi:hypothetical protein
LRDSVPDVNENETVTDHIPSTQGASDSDVCEIIEPTATTSESILANRSQVTIVPSATMDSVKNAKDLSYVNDKTKSFESANWPISISKTSSSHKSNVIPATASEKSNVRGSFEPTDATEEHSVMKKPSVSLTDETFQSEHAIIEKKGSNCSKRSFGSRKTQSSEPTELLDKLSVSKKPSVSFADESSLSEHATIERKGSNSSKRSAISRMSLFSSKKSKDSASVSKSVKSNKSGKPPMAPKHVEPVMENTNVNINIDGDQSTLVVLGLAGTDGEHSETLSSNTKAGDDAGSVAPPSVSKSATTDVQSVNPPPPVPLESRDNSMKSSRSKDSVKSSKSNITVLSKEPSVLDKKNSEVSSLMSTPKALEPSGDQSSHAAIGHSSADKEHEVAHDETKLVDDTDNLAPKSESSSDAQVPKTDIPPPPVPLVSRQNSKKSSRSKGSVKSSKSNKALISSPKLFGPPQQLSQWNGIPKSEKSVTSKRSTVPQPEIEPNVVQELNNSKSKESPLIETNTFLSNLDVSESILSPPQSPLVVGPPGSLLFTSASNKSKPSNQHAEEEDAPEDEVIGEHLLDATSTLSSKSSKQDDTVETSKSAQSKHSTGSKRTAKQVIGKEQIEGTVPATNSDVADKAINKKLTVDINDLENDPIKAVMRPFTPLGVPVCASIEDKILSRSTVDSPISANPQSDNICEMKETPVEQFKNEKSNTMERAKTMDTNVLDQKKNDKVAALSPKWTNAISKLLSPKRSSAVANDTSADVITRSDTPSKNFSRRFGAFKRSPSKVSTEATVLELSLDSAHKVNVIPPLVPQSTVPVIDTSHDNIAKSIVEEPESPSVDVDFSDNDLPTNKMLEISTKGEQKPRNNQQRKSSIFGKAKASNEEKRQMAKKFQNKTRKVAAKHKEHNVKLSAKIDETILVEDVHVTCSESSPNMKNVTAFVPDPPTPEVGEESKAIEATTNCGTELQSLVVPDHQPTPIIVVDHRSSRKVEAIGKFENKAPKQIEDTSQCDVPKLLLSDTSLHAANDESNRLYTSDDTVTETELTQVAKLDVPLDTAPEKSIPDTVTMNDDQVDAATTENSDTISSSNCRGKSIQLPSKPEPAWISSLVDWCTPETSTDINKWMTCTGQAINSSTIDQRTAENPVRPNGTSAIDEVISELNECHNFYADSLNLKTKAKSPEEFAPHVEMTSNWGSQLIEWMSPKSKQIVVEKSEQEKCENERALLETKEAANVPVQIAEEKAIQNDIQEGTEIALTNFECSADDTQVKRSRFFSSKGMFGKTLRTPFKQTKANLPATVPSRKNDDAEFCEVTTKPDIESAKHDTNTRASAFRRFLRIKAKVESKSEKNKKTVDIVCDDCSLKPKNSDKQVILRKPTPKKSLNALTKQANPPNQVKKLKPDVGMVESQSLQVDAVENHVVVGNGQNESIDSDVESSVRYLEFVKNKRKTRKQKIDIGPDKAVAIENGFNGGNDIEYQYRVNAVSDEAVEDTKLSVSVTTSSIVDSSFLSSIYEKTENEENSTVKVEKKMVPRKATATTRAKKGMSSAKTNRFLSRRKEDDSVGVSLNSNNINSFNDDLSVAFAPAVGKWLW